MDEPINKATLLAQILADPTAALKAFRPGTIPVQLIRELASDHATYDVQRFLAGYLDTPSRVLEELFAKTSSIEVLAALAENQRTPKTILQQLARHERSEVRCAVATGKAISPQTALILSEDPDANVRATLAENSAITPRVQTILSDDPVPFVRASLLKSPRLDDEIYKALCDDRDVTVQAKALLAPRISADIQLQWADTDELFPQLVLLARKQLPDPVLESLCLSTHPEVQLQAIPRKNLSADEMLGFARHQDIAVRSLVCRQEELPAIVQQILANDPEHAVRMQLARHPRLSHDAALKLISYGNPEIILALLQNPASPPAAIAVLAETHDQLALKLLAARPNLSDDLIAIILQYADDDTLYHLAFRGIPCHGMSAPIAKRLADHPLPTLRALAAQSRQLPVAIIAKLSQDTASAVRLAIARHPDAPEAILQHLVLDNDDEVQDAAYDALQQRADAARQRVMARHHSSPEDSASTANDDATAPASAGGILKRLIRKVTGDG